MDKEGVELLERRGDPVACPDTPFPGALRRLKQGIRWKQDVEGPKVSPCLE